MDTFAEGIRLIVLAVPWFLGVIVIGDFALYCVRVWLWGREFA